MPHPFPAEDWTHEHHVREEPLDLALQAFPLNAGRLPTTLFRKGIVARLVRG